MSNSEVATASVLSEQLDTYANAVSTLSEQLDTYATPRTRAEARDLLRAGGLAALIKLDSDSASASDSESDKHKHKRKPAAMQQSFEAVHSALSLALAAAHDHGIGFLRA